MPAMATSRHRIDRAELKQPDEFVVGIEKLWRKVAENLPRVIIGAVVLIALVAVGFGVNFYFENRDQAAAARFYDAMTALNHKDYKQAEAGFGALADQGSGRLSRLARVYLASALIAQKQYAQARDALVPYVDSGGDSIFQGLALSQLAVAYENLGDFAKAHQAFARAAALRGPASDSAQIGAARTLAEAGDKSGAIAAYRKFLADNPLAPEREDVIAALAAMGAAPAATSAGRGKTITLDSGPATEAATPASKTPAAAPRPNH
jgi:tetratricopeptide (TPR) repeat protein